MTKGTAPAALHSLAVINSGTVSKRSLRSDEVNEGGSGDNYVDGGERAGTLGIPSKVDKLLLKTNRAEDATTLLQLLKKTPKTIATSVQKSISGAWLNKNLRRHEKPIDVFNMLRLDRAGAKLDETPAFHQWLKYVDMYRAKKGNHWFGDSDMVQLLQKAMREEDLVTLLHSLRQVPRMKDHADSMQRILFLDSKSSHRLMNGVWLKSHERPEEVYKILNLAGARMDAFDNNALFVQWLRYTKIYNGNVKNDLFSGVQTVNFLLKTRPFQSEWEFSTLFHVMKEVPDLKRLAGNMQLNLFQKWVQEYDPKLVASYLATPYSFNVVKLPPSNPRFKTWEAYALYFAESTGGKGMLGKVKAYFADGDPSGALTALMKSQ